MKKEDFIEKALTSMDDAQLSKPVRDSFQTVLQRLKGTAQVVAMIPFPKIALAAAAFSGLLFLNIFLLKNTAANKSDDVQSLIQQYGLTSDDTFLIR